jgi:hypothetical protein
MITHTYINGIQIDSEKCFLQKLGNIAMAGVEFANYQRGGVSGQILSRPLYRGFNINLQYFVKSSNSSDLVVQRDRLVSYFQNSDDPDTYLKTLGFELSDGTIKEVEVLFSQVGNEIDPSNIDHAVFTVTAVSEREYLTIRTSYSTTITKTPGGGMPIPMAIPMDMSVSIGTEVTTLTNLGNASAYPIIRVYGDFSASFNLINDTTSKTFTFGVALGVGDYIDFDFYNRTAVKNATNSVLGSVTGDWWSIAPGTNQIRLTSPDSGDNGYAVVTHKNTYRNI